MESNELDLLLDRGITFKLELQVFKRLPGILGYFRPKIKTTEKLKFIIKEPTLSVLDRLSREQIELDIDESVFKSEDKMSNFLEAGRLTKHCTRMARIVAIAVTGIDRNKKREAKLTKLFYKSLSPSNLLKLISLIIVKNNLPDFINSIRLISINKTAAPIRIEENQQD